MSARPSLSIPDKEVSAWVAETNPRDTRAWLAALPMADSAESAREIYRSLYTLNRLELPPQERLQLMELYAAPVESVSGVLQGRFTRAPLPLTPQRRQLAEFLRQLHLEMANAYKCVLHDAGRSRMMWGRKRLLAVATDRALYYLGRVLNRSYQVYIPCPAGVWKEVHELYRFAEQEDWFEGVDLDRRENTDPLPPVYRRYLEIVLLGLCNPYQLPQGEYRRIAQFLEHWAGGAVMQRRLDVVNPVGHFLVDLSADAPPIPFPKDIALTPAPHLRALNALGLASTAQAFIARIKKGEPVRDLQIGTECIDSQCLEMLRRMIRFWGLVARRQQSRRKKKGYCFVATGINAVHFFTSGQKPFSVPGEKLPAPGRVDVPDALDADKADQAFVDLDHTDRKPAAARTAGLADALLAPRETYRVDRWLNMDESAGGLLLASRNLTTNTIRVGDIIGIQHVANPAQWRVGVARWMKSPNASSVELGVEMLAAEAKPAAVHDRRLGRYVQALLVPAVPALRRPASLVVPAGLYKADGLLALIEGEAPPREIKILKLLERTGAFEHFVFANRASL